ncbi:MAG: hypothetical protein Q9163_005374 [Psora crenata]
MKRIRLQIQVLPWDETTSQQSSHSQARPDEVRPWTQPEAADSTLQQLVDHIVERYGRIYVGRGSLRVKELQDFWGSTLDLTDTVGDLFDDRSSSGEIHTSICKVLRYPPDPIELNNPHRYESLLPESTARPQKRLQPPPVPLFQNPQRALPSIEERDIEDRNGDQQTANKRRKIHDGRLINHHARDWALRPSQYREQGLVDSSQPTGTQGSEHQVEDSQRFLETDGKKTPKDISELLLTGGIARRLYDAMMSLSSNRRQAIPTQTRTDEEAIPDSPTNRRSLDNGVEREETKSESPELRLSVHEITPLDHAQGHAKGSDVGRPVPAIGEAQTYDSAHQSSENSKDLGSRRSERSDGLGATTKLAQMAQQNSCRNSHSPATPGHDGYGTANGTSCDETSIYDPIVSDSEDFQEKQRMVNAKRLRLSKTPANPFAPTHTGHDRFDHEGPQIRTPVRLEKQQASPPATDRKAQIPSVHGSLPAITSSAANIVIPQTLRGNKPTSPAEPTRTSTTHHHPMHSHASRRRPLGDLVGKENSPFQIHTETLEIVSNGDKRSVLNKESSAKIQGERPKTQETTDATNHQGGTSTPTVPTAPRIEPGIGTAQHNTELAEAKSNSEAETQAIDKEAEDTEGNGCRDSSQAASDSKVGGGEKLHKQLEHVQRAESLANEQKSQQPKIPSTVYSKSRQLKEQQLTEQAEKMMMAADGAKQLEAEKSKLKKFSRGPTSRSDLENAPPISTQQGARNLRERRQSAALKFKQERFGSALNADGASKESHDVGKQGPPPMEASSLIDIGNAPDRKRRTLTPILPGSASSNFKPGGGHGSSPLSTKSTGSMGAPLRSAMKQPSSGLRRSVSQVSFGGVRTTSPLVSQQESKAAATPQVSHSSPSGLSCSATPTRKTNVTKKIQSKLNVTRDRKMKRRAENPLTPAKPAQMRQHVDTSSDDEDSTSSYIPEEDLGYGIAKPGPSSKRTPRSAITSTATSDNPTTKISSSSIDPALQGPRNTRNGTTTSVPAIISPQAKRKSHAPAQGLEALSVTSSSSSSSEDSSWDSDEMEDQPRKNNPRTSNGVVMEPSIASTMASQSSQVSSTTSVNSRGSHAPCAADESEHVRRDTETPTASAQNRESVKPRRREETLPNGIRPANFRYPSLSELKREAKGKVERPSTTTLMNGSSQKKPQSMADIDMSGESSDDDNESDSSDDGERDDIHKFESRFIPGMRGLMKIINGTSSQKK